MANIGTVEGTLRLRDLFTPILEKSEKDLKAWGKQVEDIGQRMTRTGAVLTAGVTLPIVGIGAAALKMATDAVEAENLFSESFGDMADAARKWSEDTGKALKLNRVELRKQAATIFVMSESMGVARDQAFDMATGITKLAGDMASFYNLDTEDAFAKLRAGLTGEAEPLKRLGILVDEATIKTAAYRHGLVEVGSELTQVQKVQARYLAIMDQTVKAQGDLARTLESPANRLRALKTRFEEILITLGTALLPAFERLLTMVDALAQKIEVAAGFFSNLPPPMQTVAVALAGIAAAAGPVLVVAGQLVTAWGALAVASPGVAAGIISVGTAIKTGLLGPLGLALAAVTALTVAVKKWADEQDRQTARIIESTDKVRIAHEKTFDAINSGSLKSMEIQKRMLNQQRGAAELRVKELEIEKRFAAQVVETWGEVEHSNGTLREAKKRLQELGEQYNSAKSEAVGYARDQAQLNKHIEVFKDVIGDELPGDLAGLRKELEKLKKEASSKGLSGEVKRLEGAIKDVDEAMKEAAGSGGGAEDLKSAFEDLEEQGEFLRDQIDAMEKFGLSADQAAEMVRVLMDPASKNKTAEEILLLISRNEELERKLEKVIALQEKQRNMPAPAIGDNIAMGSVVGSQDDFFNAVGAKAQAEEYKAAQEEANKKAEEWRKIQEKNLELALESADKWRDVGRVIASVFDDLGSDLGDLIVGIGDAAAAWKEYAAQKRAYDAAARSGDQAGMDAASAGMANAQGMGYASLWNAAGSYLGSSLAGGGTSGFGGELGGTYSEEGYQVGSLFGPVWGAVGAVLGGMIEKSGDKARVSLENFGDTIAAGVEYAEGGLGGAANTLAGEINNFIATIEGQFGIALQETGDLAFQFKDTGVLEVTIAGAVKGFRDLGEAMGWAAEQLLKLNRDVPGLGENMQKLLSGLGGQGTADNLAELQAALGLAMEADRGAMGEQLAAMQQITAQRKQDMELAQKYGLAYADVIAITDRRISQLRQEVEGMRASLFGTTDFASQASEIVNAMEAFNKGIEAETQSRRRALASVEGYTAGLAETAAEAEDGLKKMRAGGGAGEVFHQTGEGLKRASRGAEGLRASIGGAAGAMSGAAGEATGMVEAFADVKKARFEERRELFESVDAVARHREEVEALRDSLDKIPDAFSAQEIADVWTKAADDAGLALINLIRQVRGEEFGAAQERQLMADTFRLQLAVQLQAVYQLLEAAETLRASTRAILTDLARQAEDILAGPINLRPRRGGGGRDTGADQRRQIREDFRADLARLEEQMSGTLPAILDYRDGLAEIAEQAEQARRAGVGVVETARYIELASQALQDEFLAPFQEIIDAADAGPFDALLDAYRNAIALDQEMRGGGGDSDDTFEGDLGDLQIEGSGSSFGGVSQEIADAFGIELMADLEDALANASSQSEIQEIMDDFFDLDVPDELLFVFQDLFPEAFAAAGEAMDRVIQEVEDSLRGFLDDAAGIGQFQRRLMDLQQTFADARDRLGVDPPAQKDALKPITDSIQDLSEAGDDAGKVIEDVVDSMGRASDAMADAADIRDDLTDAEQRGIDRIAFDFIGTLDQLGVSLPVDQTVALAQAQFELARIEAINTALALQASGALQDVAFDWDALILALQGAEFDPSSLGLGGPAGGGGLDIDTSQPFDSYEDLLEQIQDGIDAWLNLDVGPATQGARQLLSDLDDMHELLEQTLSTGSGQAIADYAENLEAINAAFEVAVGAFVDDVLEPFEDSGLSDIEREYADLQEQFWDIAQAFEELNLGAEEMERLAAAQQMALEAFWDRATSGIQDIIDRLTGVESGRAPIDLLAEQQSTVQDLFDRVMSGDLSALEDLDAESEDLLDLIDQIYGSGRAGGILRDQLLAMLQAVAGLDPGEILEPGEPGDTGGPLGSEPGGGDRPPGDGGVLGGILDAPYVLQGADLIAEPFDLASYLSGQYNPEVRPDRAFESALEKNRREMQKYDRERERERRRWEAENFAAEMGQRGQLIRVTREVGEKAINDSLRVGV